MGWEADARWLDNSGDEWEPNEMNFGPILKIHPWRASHFSSTVIQVTGVIFFNILCLC